MRYYLRKIPRGLITTFSVVLCSALSFAQFSKVANAGLSESDNAVKRDVESTLATVAILSLYTETTYTAPWSDVRSWSCTRTLTSTSPVYQGVTALYISGSAWGAYQLGLGTWGAFQTINPALYDSLVFFIHGGTGGANLTLSAATGNTPQKSPVTVTASAGQWSRKSIPMSFLATTTFETFYVDWGSATPKFSLDNIQLITNGTVSANPALSSSVSSISFGTITINTISSEKNFTVSGTDLTPASGSITITVPAGYEVSTVSGSGFSSSKTLAYTSGTLSSTTIFSRFLPTAVQVYNGNLTIAGGGASTININLNGAGVESVSSTVSSIYTETSYTTPWSDVRSWSCTRTLSSTNPVYQGATSLYVSGQAWGAYQLGIGTWGAFQTINPTLYDSLVFFIHGGTGGANLTLSAATGNTPQKSPVTVTASAGLWSRKSIPMSSLAATTFETFNFIWGGTAPKFSLDNIQLITNGQGSLSPILLSNISSLAFGTVVVNTISVEKTMAASGSNLTPVDGSITITAPNGYEVSTVSGSGFSASTAVTYSGGTLLPTTVYVRFLPTVVQSYTGTLTLAGGGASTQNVLVSGSGVAAASPTLVTSPTSLSFGGVIVNTASSEKTYALVGTNLTPLTGTITVTVPVGYEVSATSGSGFSSTMTAAYSGGTLASKTFFVRFLPTALQSYNGTITNVGGGTQVSVSVTGQGASANNTLRVCPANRRYFTDNTGKAIYLTGSHTWANFLDQGDVNPPPAFEWNYYLNWLQGTGQNYIRLWIREHYLNSCEITTPWYLSPESMYKRSTVNGANGGGNKFNLDTFDDTWFARLRSRCLDAGQHGIYVSIVLFDGWSVWNREVNYVFNYHPYKLVNNINGIDGDPNNDGNGDVHILNTAINAYQIKYVKRLIDEVNDLDNILYEIGNECSKPSAVLTDPWIRMMIDTIHAYESTKQKQHPVGYTGDWTISNSYLNSANNHAEFVAYGAGDNGTAYETNPPAADGSKVVILDSDHLWGVPSGTGSGTRVWIWKCLTRGMNVNSMDPWNSASYGNFAGTHFDTSQTWFRSWRKNLGYANSYAKRMNLTAMTPQNSLSSTSYCLANTAAGNAEYLVYRTSGSGSFTVNVSAATDSLNVEWFNPNTGVTTLSSKVAGGATRSFTAPFSGDAVLYLSQVNSISGKTFLGSSNVTVPKEFRLYQNYPNPFNPSTTISFTLPEQNFVSLRVYDVLGREVATLVNAELPAGIVHQAILDGSKLASGIYFYRLEAGKNVQVKKLILLR